MKRPYAIHPFLFAFFPILSLFANNVKEVLFSQILIPLVIVLGFTVLLLFLLGLIFRNFKKTAVIVSIFLILFFSYGYVSGILINHLLIDIIILHAFLMVVSVTFLSFITYCILKTHRNLDNATIVLNVVGFSLIMISLISIGVYKFQSEFVLRDLKRDNESYSNTTMFEKTSKFPDIYYIILDRYVSSNNLKEFFGFDNSEFDNYLSDKGFYLAFQGRANYSTTIHSLASSLNLKHLDYLSDVVGENTDNLAPIYELFDDFEVWRFLKKKGYKFFYIGSDHWQKTMRNYLYSKTKNNFPSEFLMTLYSTTMIYPIGAAFDIDKRGMKYNEIQYQFAQIPKIAHMKDPTFVIAHMLVPHWPYVFGRRGNFITRWEERRRGKAKGYIDQLIFTNKSVRILIDKLLSNSETLPIIILQSDEGVYPQKYKSMEKNEEYYNWEEATITDFRKKFRILNAYYLPGVDKSILYPSITPVNSFRLIFNLYFDTNFELLPDKSYAIKNFRHPYSFFDITDKVKYD